jgi:hypothetical protein
MEARISESGKKTMKSQTQDLSIRGIPRNPRCEWFMRLRKCSIHEVADEIACYI